jgi:hypothetical protein
MAQANNGFWMLTALAVQQGVCPLDGRLERLKLKLQPSGSQKRRSSAALHDLAAFTGGLSRLRGSVMECGAAAPL